MRVCRALLRPADAEDAWSETFIAALRAYPRLRPGSNVRAWLVTIAHRKAIDLLRAKARAPEPVQELPDVAGGRRFRCRTRRRPVGRVAGIAVQAAQCHRVPLPRRTALRRSRRVARQQRGGSAASSRGRHRHPSEAHERDPNMTDQRTARAESFRLCSSRVSRSTTTPMPDSTRCSSHAQRMTTCSTCRTERWRAHSAHCSWPRHPRAWCASPSIERTTTRCSNVSRLDISPRILRAPGRLDIVATQLDEYFAGRRREFDIPIDLQLAHGFRRTVLQHLLRHRVRHDRELHVRRGGVRQPGRGSGRGLCMCAQPDPARGALSPRRAQRRHAWVGTSAASRRSTRCWPWRPRALPVSTRSTGRRSRAS